MCGAAAVDAAAADDSQVLRLVPRDAACVLLIKEPRHAQLRLAKVGRRIGLGIEGGGAEALLGQGWPAANWMDPGGPLAVVQGSAGAADQRMLAGRVPDLSGRLLRLPGITVRGDGIWQVPMPGGGNAFVKASGGYVAAAVSDNCLEQGGNHTGSLLELGCVTRGLARGGDLFLHVNMNAYRDSALAFVGQVASLEPLAAMVSERQMGLKAVAVEAVLAALTDGAAALLRQARFVDVSITLGEEEVDATCAVTFSPGSIQERLLQEKRAVNAQWPNDPGGNSFLEIDFDNIPTLRAAGRFLVSAMRSHMAQTRPSPDPDGTSRAASQQNGSAALPTQLDKLLQSVSRGQVSVAKGLTGLIFRGECYAPTPEILLQAVQWTHGPNGAEMTDSRGEAGVPEGEAERSDREIIRMPWRIDSGVAMIDRLLSSENTLLIRAVGKRTLLCLSGIGDEGACWDDSDARRRAWRSHRSDAWSALPDHAEMAMLVDPAAILPVFQRAWGAMESAETGSGPLVGAALRCDAGELELHLHIPIAAIERLQSILSASAEF